MFEKFSSSDIALIAAVVSPVIVVLINAHKQTRKDINNFYFRHQFDVIETYLKSLGKYIYNECSSEAAATYGVAHAEIYMYIPSGMWYLIDNMDIHISQLKNATPENYDHKLAILKVMYEELCQSFAPFARNPSKLVYWWRRAKLSKKYPSPQKQKRS